jgi:G:T-mismatch repair DNA endonuclease (very short patch repair protein)
MIIDNQVLIKGHSKNLKHYRERGYDISVKQLILVKPEDLTKGSTFIINCKCDNCGYDKKIEFKEYFNRTNSLKDKYYCFSCKGIRSAETCMAIYGVDNPMKSDVVKNILKKSLMDKYDVDHYSKTDEYKRKYKETCNIKYGVDNASKSKIVKDLIGEIRFNSCNSIDKYRNLISDDYSIISYNRDRVFNINHKLCNCDFDIFIGTFCDRIRNNNIICTSCNPVDQLSSGREIELKQFLKSKNIDFVENSYDIISPLSLDIYIPELKIAIEFNGVYWHSELFKNKDYHINKTKMCENVGIKLLHVWEDDWIYKNNIIKSIILNRVGMSESIYARKCQLREVVDTSIVRKFLNDNHIQGYSNSNIKIGLYYEDELVSLMIFGKKRKSMELIRFCNKLNTNVIGGSSKLFKHFTKNYEFDTIESFSDISLFDGKMYSNLGFDFIYNTTINYHWVVDGIRRHRFSFNKKSLVDKGHDINLSESEIMKSLGYYKIWECGLKKWIYKKIKCVN